MMKTYWDEELKMLVVESTSPDGRVVRDYISETEARVTGQLGQAMSNLAEIQERVAADAREVK